VRFKLDENLPREACALFHDAGYDALSVADQLLTGAADIALYDVCRREGRILVTLDVDFANAQAYPPGQSAGFIVLRLKQQSRPAVLSAIRAVLSVLQREPVNRRLWIVEERRIRIRA
jgi:predicted nuclease of predicted toxin-antitoxin system